jgi:hypothetical protein
MGLFSGFPTTPPFVLNPGAGQDPYLLNLAASKAFLLINQCSGFICIFLYSILLRMNLYSPGFLTGAVVLPGIDQSHLKHCLIFEAAF